MEPGTLYLVSTPIGNLSDMSARAGEVISSVAACLTEDTRRTRTLCSRLGIRVRLISFHEHNERAKTPRALEALKNGEDLALVTDAGTPLISDPGFILVRECRRRGISVRVVPGPSAVTTALLLSGFPPCPFTFVGFPPRRKGRRAVFFRECLALPHTVVLFSTPHAVVRHLEEIEEVAPDRPLFLGRELTKLHEEHLFGTSAEIGEELRGRDRIRGEITLVAGTPARDPLPPEWRPNGKRGG